MYWASVSRSLMTVSIWLLGFLLFSLLVGPTLRGNNGFNPQQEAVTKDTNYTVLRPEVINGTTYFFNTTVTNSTTTYQDNCSGHSCEWWLNRLVLLLEVISLALFVIAFALLVWGIAVQESMYLRGNVSRNGGINGGIDVVKSPFTFAWGLICVILGLFAVFVAVLIEIWVATGKHSDFFIASVIILGFFALLAALVLFVMLFRSEAPIALQNVVVPVAVQGPVVYANSNTNTNYANTNNNVNNFEPDFIPATGTGLSQSGSVPMQTLGRRLSNLITSATSPRQSGHVYSPLRNRNNGNINQ